MENVIIYALCDRDSQVLSQYMMSDDDNHAAEYFISNVIAIFKETKDKSQRTSLVRMVRDNDFVRVGTLNPATHILTDDFNVLIDLREIDFEHYEQELQDEENISEEKESEKN